MNMTKIISIVNQKGGTGKSACTANYGVGLAQMKKKVNEPRICSEANFKQSKGQV